MDAREAKDFLVEQIAKQASLESIPLSDLEKRMLYFTEGKSAVEDPVALNAEFEAQYDTEIYEKKISELMKHAYKRATKEDTPSKQRWDEAIRTLKKGDHYILVMWSEPFGMSSVRESSSTTVIVVAVVVGIVIIRFVLWFTHKFAPPNPRLLLAISITAVALCVIFQRRLGQILDWILDRTLFRLIDSKNDKE